MKTVTSGKTDKFSYSFKLSDDRLKLFLDIAPLPLAPPKAPAEGEVAPEPQPFSLTKKEILDVFPKEVWDGCIHHDVVEHIAQEVTKGQSVTERRIAKGSAAEDGKDGRYVLTVKKMTPKPELQEDAKGYVDFKDLHRFENIRSGTVIAKLFPPSQGKPGTDPLGKSLSAKNGQGCKLRFDQTIITRDHPEGGGQDLCAAVDGYLVEEGGTLSIQQELKVSGSIDYTVGSIDFVGNVIIQGDVLPGFVVRGRKGVVIKGAVQEATVCSSEGSIELKGPCMGSINSKIEAKTQITLAVANHVDAQAGEQIVVMKEARDCQLRTGGTLTGSKSALIGGSVFAACGVEAREIGARGGTTTTISLSSNVAMTKEFAENERLIHDHEKVLAMLKAHLGPLAKTEAGLNALASKHKERLAPMFQKKRAIETSLKELELNRLELLRAAKTNHQFKVNFLETLHSGVLVKVGEEQYSAKEDIKGPKSLSYHAERKAFDLGELTPLECSILDNSKTEEKPK